MLRWIAVVVCAWAPGCADIECEPIEGSYQVSFTEESGDCGPVPDTVVTLIGGAEEPGDGCVLDQTPLSSTCETDFTLRCPDPGGYYEVMGHTDAYYSGSRVDATWSFVSYFDDDSVFCASVYRVVYRRL